MSTIKQTTVAEEARSNANAILSSSTNEIEAHRIAHELLFSTTTEREVEIAQATAEIVRNEAFSYYVYKRVNLQEDI